MKTTWQVNLEIWKQKYNHARAIADRVTKMRNDRARRACQEAGLDPQLLGIHPHNAMISFDQGRPWPNINYSKVRLCQRILAMEFEANRIVDRYSDRLWKELLS